MRKIFALLGAAVLGLAAFVGGRTALYKSAESAVERAPYVAIPEGADERLAGSLRIATISHEDSAAFDSEAFRALHAYLRAAFPQAHSRLNRETVDEYSLLYT
jgi:carboxypeptidase PM20D1